MTAHARLMQIEDAAGGSRRPYQMQSRGFGRDDKSAGTANTSGLIMINPELIHRHQPFISHLLQHLECLNRHISEMTVEDMDGHSIRTGFHNPASQSDERDKHRKNSNPWIRFLQNSLTYALPGILCHCRHNQSSPPPSSS